MPSNQVLPPVPSRHGIALAFASAFPLAPAIAGLLAAGIANGAHAQATPAASAPQTSAPAAAGQAMAGPQATGRRSLAIEPRVSVTETLTDNVLLNDANKRSDSITQLSVGVRAASDAGRVRGHFDYSLSKLLYAKTSEKSTSQNALNTFGTAELVDNWAFVDFNGNISQQSISAFGTQTPGVGVVNSNSTEVASYRLSPYVRGKTFAKLNYEARYARLATRSKGTQASDIDQSDVNLKLGSDSSLGRLSWSADLSRQEVDYSLGRDTEADRLRVVLTYTISPQLDVYVIGGRENNNYATLAKESHGSAGIGANWALSERTRLSAETERRFFAHVHKLSLEHRTPRTVWRYTDAKDVTTNPAQGTVGTIGTLYDLFFAQFASIQPDPILRAQMVNAFLQANGLNPNATTGSGFLASSVSVQRRQDLSFALMGVRDTLTLVASRSETRRMQGVAATGDDLSLSPVVQQRSFTASYAHRLTPQSSLNVIATHQKTAGATGLQGSTLKSYNVSVSSRLGLKVTGSVGARHVIFSGSAAPYTENAVTGSLNVQF